MLTKTKIYLSSPHMGGSEQKFVNEAFDTNWIAPLGPNVIGFEQDLERFLGEGAHVAALSSGTASIHLALELCGVSRGDEVLCQSFTFSASANPITYLGAKPIFIDSEKDTWNICPELLELAIKDRIENHKKPKAIIAVHLYGMPYKVKEINALSAKYNIPVIEDSAEALGSTYFGKACGTLSKYGVLSFNGNKIITTSGGGALIAHNENDKDRAVFLATQARDKAAHYQHTNIGYNYRLSNVLAGIGRGQMEVLGKRVEARRFNYEFYKAALSDISSIRFLDEPNGMFSNRWITCILTESFEQREQIRLLLQQDEIESRPLWKPMHMQPVFKDNTSYTNDVSADLFEKGLCLPSGSNLTENQLQRIVDLIRKTSNL
ncbi:DegT/DnrJ/EryC1/StrS family aminotransferase [Cognatitamlana onchidii]|uniref:DegT/DnrJ/EryC1/StrS family aminotransferase n=1 Tax=Cognatitamlana onchidii TaxID=2562860 RepID=UPI0010A6AD13|nr:aminotransferase class I/II-fold pyridoxal phosphate-dependent enzyme [Algibacter onchidii]